MSYYEPEEEFYGGFDPSDPAMIQAMLDQYLMGTGETFGPGGPYGDINVPAMDPGQYDALAGLLPNAQPSGKPMTVSNITGALSANRSALFDPALMGFGGMDAFAPNVFESTVTSTIRQEPELQQVYSYLRSPTSMEGIITQELMAGGTPATAQRNLRQMLTASDEEVAAIFAEYDALFGRTPSVTVADVPLIRENLLLELPPAFDEMTQTQATVEPDGTGVDWNSPSENSVIARAGVINELNASIPRIGPSGPKWDPATGQMLSAGGELQWSVDETGAPVMIEVTETPSPLAEKYHALGLPTPDEEYTTEDFLPGGWQGESDVYQQAVPEIQTALAEAKQRWRDATPPGPLGLEQLAGTPPAQQGAGAGAGAGTQQPEALWEESLLDVIGQNPSGDTSGIVNSITRQGLWDLITGNEGEGQPGGGPREEDALRAAATTGTLGGNYLADAILQNPSGDTGGVWNSIKGQGLWDVLTGNEGPGGGQPQPSGPDYPAGDPATYEEFLAQQGGNAAPVSGKLLAGGGNRPRLRPTGEGEPPEPGFGDNPLADALQQMIQAGQPASLPPYAQPGAQPARQPGQPVSTATPEMTQAMLMQIMSGNTGPGYLGGDREPARQPGEPGYRGGDREPARQPGGPEYIETGEEQAREARRNEPTGIPTRAGAGGHQLLLGGQSQQRNYDRYSDRSELKQIRAADKAERDRLYGADFGTAWAQARNLRQQGVRPLDQALMARRLVLMGAGMPQGRMPGL